MSGCLTPRTVFVVITFWTVDATVINDDKHCPRLILCLLDRASL